MTGWRDTRPANWRKTSTRLKRNAAELRKHGAKVTLPEDFDTPPHQRIAKPSVDK